MRMLILAFITWISAYAAHATVYDVGTGTFEAPDEFVLKHTGTIDSFRGTLTRNGDGFIISFDIGQMAGVHMGPSKQDKCVFYRSHKINDNSAFTGIECTKGIQKITTTIYEYMERSRVLGEETAAMFKLPELQRRQAAEQLNKRYEELKKDKRWPANFWAEVKSGADVADFLLIVSTYKPKILPAASEQ